MAAAAGLLNQHASAQAMMSKATPMATSTTSGTDSSSSSSDDASTISANDFLTLLVTEMQNQDPTADTDPNEYIDQLVQVNSLEQLININQTLTGAFDPSSTTDGTTAAAQSAGTGSKVEASAATQSSAAAQTQSAKLTGATPAAAEAPGNLSVPSTNAAAQRVGQSLNGHTSAHRRIAAPGAL